MANIGGVVAYNMKGVKEMSHCSNEGSIKYEGSCYYKAYNNNKDYVDNRVAEGIEKHRKGDFVLKFKSDGKKKVKITHKKHTFRLSATYRQIAVGRHLRNRLLEIVVLFELRLLLGRIDETDIGFDERLRRIGPADETAHIGDIRNAFSADVTRTGKRRCGIFHTL